MNAPRTITARQVRPQRSAGRRCWLAIARSLLIISAICGMSASSIADNWFWPFSSKSTTSASVHPESPTGLIAAPSPVRPSEVQAPNRGSIQQTVAQSPINGPTINERRACHPLPCNDPRVSRWQSRHSQRHLRNRQAVRTDWKCSHHSTPVALPRHHATSHPGLSKFLSGRPSPRGRCELRDHWWRSPCVRRRFTPFCRSSPNNRG